MAIPGILSIVQWPDQHPVGDPFHSQAASSKPECLIFNQKLCMPQTLTWLCLLFGHYRRNLTVRNAPNSGKGLWGACHALAAWGGPWVSSAWSVLGCGEREDSF